MRILGNQKGAALIVAMVVLTLLTIIGLAATNTATLETMISSTERGRSEAFYAAEGGIEHLRRNFKSIFLQKNQAKFAAGIDPDWDFALEGPDETFNSSDDATGSTYLTGARWITDGNLNSNCLYNVTVWDNDDGGTAGNEHRDDTDGVIFLRADARVSGGGSASIEIMLKGATTSGDALNGYGAQEGGGAGKNYSNNDVNAVDVSSYGAQIGGSY
ncbi:MAG: pilus assembly PilX N-terminal domain-containing protein [Desulfuromonadaceae bacterium]